MSISTALAEGMKKHAERHAEKHPKGEKHTHHRIEVEKMDDGTFSLKGHKHTPPGEEKDYHFSEPTKGTAKNRKELKTKFDEMMCPCGEPKEARTGVVEGKEKDKEY